MRAIKPLLYIAATVIVMVFLYVNSIYVLISQITLRQETFDNCMKAFGMKSFTEFDLCLKQSVGTAHPIWLYLIFYLPAGLLWWLKRSLNINPRLSIDTYPKRSVIVMVWLGLTAATYAIILTLWIEVNFIYKPPFITFMPAMILSGWLIAPLLFQHLHAPAEAVLNMSALKIGLVLMFVTPVIVVSISFINIILESLPAKSLLIT